MTALADPAPVPARGATPPPLRVAARCARDRRRALLAWSLGIGVYVALIVAMWPTIHDASGMTEAIQDYPDAMKEMFGGAANFELKPGGYLNTQLFSLMAPLFLSAFAIGYAASTLAGEERAGRLDLVLATPCESAQGPAGEGHGRRRRRGVPHRRPGRGGAGRRRRGRPGHRHRERRRRLRGVPAPWPSCTGRSPSPWVRPRAGGRWPSGSAGQRSPPGTSWRRSAAWWRGSSRCGRCPPCTLANGSVPIRTGLPVGNLLVLGVVTAVLVGLAVVLFERQRPRHLLNVAGSVDTAGAMAIMGGAVPAGRRPAPARRAGEGA